MFPLITYIIVILLVILSFPATAQFLCAIADVLSFALSGPVSSILNGKICTAFLCAAVLASAIACFCMQVDVASSASLPALAFDFVRTHPYLFPALIGVVSSAACIPLHSSAALISCCCFCSTCCFLFGFPAKVRPQSNVLTKGKRLPRTMRRAFLIFFVHSTPGFGLHFTPFCR
jgi:hypothetical protein